MIPSGATLTVKLTSLSLFLPLTDNITETIVVDLYVKW